MPYHTIHYHTTPYHTMPYHTIQLYHTCTVPYLTTILYHTLPYHTIVIPYHTTIPYPHTLPYPHALPYLTIPYKYTIHVLHHTMQLYHTIPYLTIPYHSTPNHIWYHTNFSIPYVLPWLSSVLGTMEIIMKGDLGWFSGKIQIVQGLDSVYSVYSLVPLFNHAGTESRDRPRAESRLKHQTVPHEGFMTTRWNLCIALHFVKFAQPYTWAQCSHGRVF